MKKKHTVKSNCLRTIPQKKAKTIKLFLRKKKIEINYIIFLSTNERKGTIFSRI